MPGERSEGKAAIARGVREGDVLRKLALTCHCRSVPETSLTLDVMQLGASAGAPVSWTERALRLRDTLGPFRLAFLKWCCTIKYILRFKLMRRRSRF